MTRWALIAGAACGCAGALVGLVVGLHTYAPTAWAAAFEVGVPAAAVGVLLGAAAGLVGALADRVRAGRET